MIDEAIDRLVEAYRAAGLPPIRPARDVAGTLAEIRREIAPLRLPDELDRLWRRIDPESIRLTPYPHPTSPEFALDCWRSHRDEFPDFTPRLLFPICYQSHGFLLVELEDGHGSGGICVQWGLVDGPFEVRHPSVAAYLDLLATMVELREFAYHERDGRSWYEFDPDGRWPDAQAVRLAAAQPLPGFGHVRTITHDPRGWPEHWLRSSGLTPEMRTPRGADTTVADLLRAAGSGREATGTIHGQVVGLAGSSAGCRVTVDDGTGRLDVWCPSAVCIYGPALRRSFEFDVVVAPAPAPAPDLSAHRHALQQAASTGDPDTAAAAAARLFAEAFEAPAAAQATAIRPLD